MQPDLADGIRRLACDQLLSREHHEKARLLFDAARELEHCHFILRRVVPTTLDLATSLAYTYLALFCVALAVLYLRLGFDWVLLPMGIGALACLFIFTRLFFLRR